MKRKYVYSINHFKEYNANEDIEQRKNLGIFTSRKKAKEALEKYKQLPGFVNDKKGELFIARDVLGLSFWDGGYTTVGEIMSTLYGTVIYEDEEEEFTEIVLDLPDWFKEQQRLIDETNEDFAGRLMKEKYPEQEYPRGPQSEFFQIKRFLDLTHS